MKKLVKIGVIISVLATINFAHATDYYKPSSSNQNTNLKFEQHLGQQQQQKQQQQQLSESGSASTSGGNSLQTGSTTNNSNVDNRFLYLPSHVVPVPPSIISGANVVQSIGSCGVLQKVKREEVLGTYHGLFSDSKVSLGVREVLVPYVDEDGNEVLFKEQNFKNLTYLIGHQTTIISSVVSTGGAKQFGLGGNSSSGNNGSGSIGSSGSNQQMVEHIQLSECIFQVIDNSPASPKIEQSVPVITKKLGE